jgi:glutathione S-transferase
MWLFALYIGNDGVAAGLGAVWIIGRVIYMLGYAKAAESRSPGFAIQALAMFALLFGALGAVIWRLIQHGL